jgi:hypothetical protein
VTARASGRCLCGAVRYEVGGAAARHPARHCEECRRWSGYLGAFSAARAEHLVLLEDAALRWVASAESDRNARRGFCGCGSGLFWHAAGSERINITAGTLDRPTGLRVAGHWYTHSACD